MCTVNLVVIVAYACPDRARACCFEDQVLVPLTSQNAHMKADVSFLSDRFMCEKQKVFRWQH